MYKRFFLFFLALIGIGSNLKGQEFKDYTPFPPFHAYFHHLEGEFHVDESLEILKGNIQYTFSPVWETTDTLVLLSFENDLQSVLIDDNPVDFIVKGDSVCVPLPKGLQPEQNYQLHLYYTTEINKGFQKQGSFLWTSAFPFSNAYWLPGPLHPTQRMTTSLTFVSPSNYMVISSGRLDHRLDAENKSVWQWTSRHPVSLTDIRFAAGNLSLDSFYYGSKKIYLSYPVNSISKQEVAQYSTTVYEYLKEIEGKLNHEFPFDGFTLFIAPDHRWEIMPYGAGWGVIFENGINMRLQLQRAIVAQWFGVEYQGITWDDKRGDVLFQTKLVSELFDVLPPKTPQELPSLSSQKQFPAPLVDIEWAKLKSFFDSAEGKAHWAIIIDRSIPSVMNSPRKVFRFSDFERLWYERSGMHWVYPSNDAPISEVRFDTLALDFRVLGDTLQVEESAISKQQEVHDITIHLTDETGTRSVPFTVGSKSETQHILVQPPLSMAYATSSEPLLFLESKPDHLWIGQLRKAPSLEIQLKAAQAPISENAEDIELVLLELLKKTESAELKAAILTQYARHTHQAKGTEQTFIDATRNDSFQVRKAGYEGLKGYPGNTIVGNVLRAGVRAGKTEAEARVALRSLLVVDTTSNHTALLLKELKKDPDQRPLSTEALISSFLALEDTTSFTTYALQEVRYNHSYSLREALFLQWLDLQPSQDEVVALGSTLLKDNDPRIRYLAASEISERFFHEEWKKILMIHVEDEVDARVNELISHFLSEEH